MRFRLMPPTLSKQERVAGAPSGAGIRNAWLGSGRERTNPRRRVAPDCPGRKGLLIASE